MIIEVNYGEIEVGIEGEGWLLYGRLLVNKATLTQCHLDRSAPVSWLIGRCEPHSTFNATSFLTSCSAAHPPL
jgi:hypothetical protein